MDDIWEPVIDGTSETDDETEELMLDSHLAVWELLENATARTTIGEFFKFVQEIHETETSAQMMLVFVEETRKTLTDKNRLSLSVKYLVDGVVELVTSPPAAPTLKAIYKSCHKVIQNPNTIKWLHKVFNFLEACAKAHRGPELISSMGNGVCNLLQKPDPKGDILTAFINEKCVMNTSVKKTMQNRGKCIMENNVD